jgi:Rieske Fe-S protein
MVSIGMTRRGFLNFVTNCLLLVLALLLLIPAVIYVLSPVGRKRGKGDADSDFVDAGPLEDIPLGEWRLLSLEVVHEDGWRQTRTRHAVWVRRQGQGVHEINVLSSNCPHLGCPVNWHSDQAKFVCPCHTGVFDAAGQKVSGPPPRDMDPLPFKVRFGRLWVRWQDFKIGVREQIPVNV